MRAGKTSVSGVHLTILLCGFPKALFTKKQSAMPCTAGVSGNVALEKDIKNTGSPQTARMMDESHWRNRRMTNVVRSYHKL